MQERVFWWFDCFDVYYQGFAEKRFIFSELEQINGERLSEENELTDFFAFLIFRFSGELMEETENHWCFLLRSLSGY